MNKFIPVNEPLLNGNEKKYLNECIDTGWISSEGPFIQRFEAEFAKKVSRKYAVAVSNGTVAIDAAITALDIRAGDEVIMPTFTIISCIGQLIKLGAKPVLVDCDEKTWNIKVEDIESRITARTKAIMIVHIYGLPVDVNPILALAKKYGLKIIEDAAEMHGQRYDGKPCGSFGDVSTFSFYPNKHITTGEGGMIVTDNEDIYQRCVSLRNLCFQPSRRFVHEEIGWNLRMTNMQAALGVAQLERLDEFVVRKKEMGKLYTELLQDLTEYVDLPVSSTSYSENIYWVYGIVLKPHVPMDAIEMMKKLGLVGVGTRPFFYPMHLQPVFTKNGMFAGESYPNSEYVAEKGFYLPSGMALQKGDIEQVAKKLKEVLCEI